MPAAPARWIASVRPCENPSPPHDADSTRRLTPAFFAWTAQSIAPIAPAIEPSPLWSSIVSDIRETRAATPVIPIRLLPTAPRIPATWVPCPYGSVVVHCPVNEL